MTRGVIRFNLLSFHLLQIQGRFAWSSLRQRCCLIANCVQLFATPWPVACQAPPLSMRFPRQEYWSGLSFPPPGDLPDPGIKPTPPALAGRLFSTESREKPT